MPRKSRITSIVTDQPGHQGGFMKGLVGLMTLLLVAGIAWGQEQESTQDAIARYKNASKAYEDAAMELQRIDLRNSKRELIKGFLNLNETQSKAFWPIYDKYEKDL